MVTNKQTKKQTPLFYIYKSIVQVTGKTGIILEKEPIFSCFPVPPASGPTFPAGDAPDAGPSRTRLEPEAEIVRILF